MSDTYDEGTEALKKLAEEVEHERESGLSDLDAAEEVDEGSDIDEEAPADGPRDGEEPDPVLGIPPQTRYM